MRLILILALLASSCGPKTVKLTIPELHDLADCIREQEDEVEKQNCIERHIPPED